MPSQEFSRAPFDCGVLGSRNNDLGAWCSIITRLPKQEYYPEIFNATGTQLDFADTIPCILSPNNPPPPRLL
jgi:hypothetical protein